MKIKRSELVKALEMVSAGLSTKEESSQSDCFAFSKGSVMTFNDEIAASAKVPIKGTSGAVHGRTLLEILRKYPDEMIDVDLDDAGNLTLKGRGKDTVVSREEEILLPVQAIESPGEWEDIDEEFLNAMDLARTVCGKDEGAFVLTCINLHPEWIEACDGVQVMRCPFETGMEEPLLIRGFVIAHCVNNGVTQWSRTAGWTHFRNEQGLILSCRRFSSDYVFPTDQLDTILDFEGAEVTFPKDLSEIVNRSETFSRESPKDNLLLVELKKGRLRITGSGAYGKHSERKKVAYDGPDMAFNVSPRMLVEVTKRAECCELSDDKLRITTDKFTYLTCLASSGE